MTYYPHLFAKGMLGNIATKNRIVMSPMGDNMANADGSVSEQSIAYYAERAKGGAGIIIPGVFSVDYPGGKTITNQHRIDQAKYIKDLERMSKEVHRYGALLIPQIHHAGMSTEVVVTEGMAPVQVSASESEDEHIIGAMVDEELLSKVDTKLEKTELSTEEIKTLVQKFITAAVYCQRANCDGVEIHGAHGYLISQFLSSFINKRTDEYGGSLENRMRFPVEVIEGIRKSCGKDFIIGIRMPVHKFDTDGLTDEESLEMARAFVAAGCDFIDASGGFPPVISAILESQKYPQGNRIELAQKIKKAVDVPVFAVGVLREPDYCEKVLAEGKADFVCLGRTLIADPYWPAKAKSGKTEEIRKCISCLDGCYGALGKFQSVRCAINPVVGYESEYARLQPALVKKTVVIVGGGVAGMQAAITATERGHKAIIIEKSGQLGGQLNIASVPPHKQYINWATEWFVSEVSRKNIEVLLNTEATIELISSYKPDSVILASGAIPVSPAIPGVENTVQAWDLLSGAVSLPQGKNVAVIGGGIVGCETACLLSERGNAVTVLEMLPEYAKGLELTHKWDLDVELVERNISMKMNSTVKSIHSAKVSYTQDGKDYDLLSDMVVLAIGQKSFGAQLAAQLEDQEIPYVVVGDANKPAKILKATGDGFFASINL